MSEKYTEQPDNGIAASGSLSGLWDKIHNGYKERIEEFKRRHARRLAALGATVMAGAVLATATACSSESSQHARAQEPGIGAGGQPGRSGVGESSSVQTSMAVPTGAETALATQSHELNQAQVTTVPSKETQSPTTKTTSQASQTGKPWIKVVGTCLTGWDVSSGNFQPNSKYYETITRPDHTSYNNPLNNGVGVTTSTGELQSKWACEKGDLAGTWTLAIVGVGADGIIGTQDDQRVQTQIFEANILQLP